MRSAEGASRRLPFQWENEPASSIARRIARLSHAASCHREKTAYHRGRRLIFSDVQLLHSLAQSDAERDRISKALSRTPTLMLKLHLKPDTDLPKLVEYWSTQNKRKDIAPFLESMALTPGADKVDIIHLLPPTARKLLNSYPNVTQIRGGMLPDCHWTSLNFLNYDTVDRLVDPPLASAYAVENFEKVSTPTSSAT